MSRAEPAEDPLSLALAAAAHPVRRRILSGLAEGPRAVTDIADGFAISLPAISKHLKVLEQAGLVERQIIGRRHFIALRPERIGTIAEWAGRQQAEWGERLGRLKSIMEE